MNLKKSAFLALTAVAMLPPQVYATSASRNVNQSSTEGVLVRDVANDMVLLEPDTTPLLVLTTNNKRKQGTKAPKFESVEDAEVSFWGQVNNGTTDLSSVSTAIPVADVTLFAAGIVVAVPKAVTSTAAEELMLVTAVTGTTNGTITVTRGMGGGADTVSATGSLRIVGGAYLENDSLPSGLYTTKTTLTSYCQIFRTVVDVSETERSTEIYGAPEGEEKFQIAKAMIRHKAEIEAAGWWSRASETAAAQSRWTTAGFKSRVTTNVTDAGGTVTLTKFNDYSETAFRFGERRKLFSAAPKVISAMNYFSQNKLLTKNEDTVFGVKLQRFITPHGELMLVRNFRMENGIAGANGFGDEAYAVDMPSVQFRYLNGNGKSRDTKLYSDVKKDGVDGVKSEVKSQVGWQFRHERRHSRLIDVLAYS